MSEESFSDGFSVADEIFYRARDFDAEIRTKLRAMQLGSAVVARAYALEVGSLMSQVERERLGRLMGALNASNLDSVYSGYLVHPLRVSESYSRRLQDFSYETASFGLCHNIFENAPQSAEFISREFLSESSVRKIKLLTIDRSLERDSGYLERYYDRIAEVPELMIFKALDKLDNLFLWVRHEIEDWHRQVVVDYVVPRILALDARLAHYLCELCPYVLRDSVKQKFKEV